MKAHEALIAWSGLDDPPPYSGAVSIGRLVKDGQVDWTGTYTSTDGAALFAPRQMRGSDNLIGLFRDFHYLVVDECLDPEAVHKAFLAIDEYADVFRARSR